MTEQEFNRNINGIRKHLICFAEGFATTGAATPEDMVQEAVMRVWRLNCNGETFRNIEAVSVAILKNICLDYIKLRKNQNYGAEGESKMSFIRSECPSPEQALEVKDKIEQLKIYIRHLPAEHQVVLRLRDVMGYELDEIAVVLNTSQGNVRTMLSRARGKLRHFLLNCE